MIFQVKIKIFILEGLCKIIFFIQKEVRIGPSKKEKFDFKKKKENTLASLNEVENFLFNYKHFIKYVKLYNWFRK